MAANQLLSQLTGGDASLLGLAAKLLDEVIRQIFQNDSGPFP